METSAPKRRRTSPRTAIPIQPDQPAPESMTPRNAPPRPGTATSRPRESEPRRLRSSPDVPLPASRAVTPDSTGGLTRALRTQLELRSGTRHGSAQAAPEEGSILRSPGRRLGPGATRPTPRPLPPPDPEDEELLNVDSSRGLPRSLGVLPKVVVPEPELPPTPKHHDPVVSTPPSGIHNTPSKRPKRSKALAEKIKSSPPLKQPPSRPSELPQKDAPPAFNLPIKRSQVIGPPVPEPTTAELRGLKPVDPDADKKKLRESLLAEIADLERDLSLASQENERIRQARVSRRDASPPPNKDDLLHLLHRHALPTAPNPPKSDPATDWLASALNPIAFLPFSKPSTTPLPLPLPTTVAKEDNLPPPPSHHPLPMTAAEALPYLQVFTPLTFTSHVSPLPQSASSNTDDKSPPLLQHHTITASSASPRGLFSARIEMTVNTKTMAVTELAVPKVDLNAEGELRPFIDSIIKKPNGVSSSGLENNISVLAWGMGEWVRVAVRRARVWSVLEKELNGGKGVLREMVAGMRVRKKKRRRRRRAEGEDADDDDDGEEEESEEGTGKYEAAELLPFMGRTSMDFEVPVLDGSDQVSALRVLWRIKFDWTGEARSDIGVLVGVPGKWHKTDERGRLSGIPGLFDELIQGGEDPLTAVRTVVCLLVGEQRS